jgi:hypothetical protein
MSLDKLENRDGVLAALAAAGSNKEKTSSFSRIPDMSSLRGWPRKTSAQVIPIGMTGHSA